VHLRYLETLGDAIEVEDEADESVLETGPDAASEPLPGAASDVAASVGAPAEAAP
jgi:hypothetical protein